MPDIPDFSQAVSWVFRRIASDSTREQVPRQGMMGEETASTKRNLRLGEGDPGVEPLYVGPDTTPSGVGLTGGSDARDG